MSTTTNTKGSNTGKNAGMREQVREGYAKVAREAGSCCGPSMDTTKHAGDIGYTAEELKHIPEDANLGLGCGNPTALAQLSEGDVVVDLGSGAGMDAFLAAARVGPSGRVIGVDMTEEMLAKARGNAVKQGVQNFVEFREGYIEELPVVSDSVDLVISNCVINLSDDKPAVFKEAHRVLKAGGRMAVSDICLTGELPQQILDDAASWVACVGGAVHIDDYLAAMKAAGFEDIQTDRTSAAPVVEGACCDPSFGTVVNEIDDDTMTLLRERVWSYKITARKAS